MVGDLALERYQHILVLIERHQESLSQKALAEILEVDKSYMVTIIDYLSEKGYVVREKNPADRREQLIRLTDWARRDLVPIKKAFEELNRRLLTGIEEQDIAVFNRVLAAIDANLSLEIRSDAVIQHKKP
ncbi:MAG TPA: MarR family transcriptional regulator [Sphingobacteriaceae bacterium]